MNIFVSCVCYLNDGCICNNNHVVLQKNLNLRKPLEIGVKPKGRSFACKHLQMVKIKCSKDDARIHKLAFSFRANSVPVEKIFVRRTGSTCESYLLFTYLISQLFTMPCYITTLFLSPSNATDAMIQSKYSYIIQDLQFLLKLSSTVLDSNLCTHPLCDTSTRSSWQEDDEGSCQA